MSGYLEEKFEKDGSVLTWQTPNRQRLWALLVVGVAGAILMHATQNLHNILWPEVYLAGALFVGAVLVALYTVRFSLNLRAGTYQNVKGFLPVFFWGERGKCLATFQCLAIRKDTLLDASRHENDPNAESFDQYRLMLVWKDPRREAFLLDTCPLNYSESLMSKDFHGKILAKAYEFGQKLDLEVLDQTVTHAVVEVDGMATATDQPANSP